MTDRRQLEGKRIVITGASAGIGEALALALASRGARLVLAARDTVRLREVADACVKAGVQVAIQTTDVSKPGDCRLLVEHALTELGGLDVLVNNAGSTMWSRFDALSDLSIFDELLKVNYLGAVHLTGHALPALKASRGLIVTVASVAAFTGVPERTAYAASKHAVVGFMESLRIELAGSGVGVTIVAPDFVLSETHKRAIGPDGKPLGASPMQTSRLMTAAQCAAHIVNAIERRKRLAILSARGRIGRWLKLIAPGLIDRIAARAIRRRY
ncbi:MAG TPA: SDR family oxidoreductase [Steroidobacteraceae bacterium]|nr:SDR family oxidoreductase [Steroidobacteraceae bacterium]